MQVKTNDGNYDVASKGLGNTALGIGIAGSFTFHERYHISWQREKPSCQGSLLLLQQDFRVRCSFNTRHRMTIHQQKER